MRVVVGVVVVVVVASGCEPRTISPDAPEAICRFTTGTNAWAPLAGEDVPRVVSVAADARARGVIVAGTVNGLYASADCASSFAKASAGPRGIVNAVATGKEGGDFIASAGGLWRTSGAVSGATAALSWQRVTSSPPIIDARSIAANDFGIFVASVGAVGVAGSFNDDDGWFATDVGDAAPLCVAASFDGTNLYACAASERRAVFAPSSSNVVYAVRVADVAGGRDSIARSSDGGATFADADVHAGPGSDEAHTVFTGVAVDGADDAFLYAATASPPAIWTSDDAGVTWTQQRAIVDNSGSTAGSPVATAADTDGFAVVRTSTALLRTDDHGATWDETAAPGSPGAGIIDVSLTSHAIAFSTATALIIDGAGVDVGSRITALTHQGDAFVAATQAGVVRVDGGAAQTIGDGPGGFFADVAESPADGVVRLALVGDMQAAVGDGGAFSSIFVDDGAVELTPGGDLASTSEGVVAANGHSGTCFLLHDVGGDSEGHADDFGASAYDAVAAAPDSPTVWLVSSSTGEVAVSGDGGASTEDAAALPAGLSPPVALDGGSLALLSTRTDDGGADGTPVVVDVNTDGTVAARTPPLPCTPAQLVIARGLDDLAYVVAGGDCAQALIVGGIP